MGLLDMVRAARARQGKISHHPELQFREHVISQGAGAQMQAVMDDYAGYARVYRVHSWVRKAITIIANNIAPLPIQVVDAEGEEVANHEVTQLFNMPNDTQSQAEFWEEYVIHMMLGGEAFMEFVPNAAGTKPVEAWLRRPDLVGVRPDASEERKLFPTVAGYQYGSDDLQDMIPAEWMHHSKFTNPNNPWRGIAPITALRSALIIDMFASAWSRKFLQSGARPDFGVIAPNGITPTEREKMEADLATKFGGTENAHKPIILEEGVTDIKPFSFPPKDIEWLEQRRFSRDEVGAVFAVPDEVMGYGRDTYENMDAAHRWLWLLTLVPFIRRRDDGLTKFFTIIHPTLDRGLKVHTDLANVAALQEDILPKLEAAEVLWGMGIPFNVINQRLQLGFEEVEGGDVGYIPFSLFPVGEMPARASAATAPVTNILHLPKDAELIDLRPTQETLEEQLARAHTAIEFDGAVHRQVWDTFEARKKPYERKMQRELKRQFQRQQNETLRNLRDWFADNPPPPEEEVAAAASDVKLHVKTPAPALQELFDFDAETVLFYDEFYPLYETGIGAFGDYALGDAGAGIAFDLADPFVVAHTEDMTFKFANDINLTTQQRMGQEIAVILAEAAEQGMTIAEMQAQIYNRVSTVFDVRKSDYETERIARTEMNRAGNGGTMAGWRQSGIVEGKAWLAALDDRTRDTHVEAHLQYQVEPIPLEQDFYVGGHSCESPGGTGITYEDINCRCTMVSVIIGTRSIDAAGASSYSIGASPNGGNDNE
jgi:HK97 family phage portal protein